MLFPDGFANPPVPDPGDPILTVAQIAPLLGLTTPVAEPLNSQILFASRAISRLLRQYTGRMLSKGTYVESFTRPGWSMRTSEGGRWGISVALTEWPVTSITSITLNGTPYVGSPSWQLHHALGRLWFPWEGNPTIWNPMTVTYVGGYDPFPDDLLAVYLNLVRLQLASMGVDLSSSTIQPPTAPVKAVTVGALKVDYAVANIPPPPGAGGTSPLSVESLGAYEAVLGQYCSARKFSSAVA